MFGGAGAVPEAGWRSPGGLRRGNLKHKGICCLAGPGLPFPGGLRQNGDEEIEAKSHFRAHPRQQSLDRIHGMNWEERHTLLSPFPSPPLPSVPGDVEKHGRARNVRPGGEKQAPQGGGHRKEEGVPGGGGLTPVLPLADVISGTDHLKCQAFVFTHTK